LPILFNFTRKCLTTENLEGLGDFKVGEKIILSLKYADDLVVLAKQEWGATGHH